jgi:peptidoglycan hydrolase CwlO-like protein
MGWGRYRIGRLVMASLLASGALTIAPTLSSAAPTKAEIQTAKAELASLYRDLDLLVEQYNQANSQLQQIRTELAEKRDVQTTAEAEARSAITSLEGRVSSAYMDRGSQLDVLLGAGSFSEFSDRLEFLSRLQEDDAALAARAEVAGQRAAGLRLSSTRRRTRRMRFSRILATRKARSRRASRNRRSW